MSVQPSPIVSSPAPSARPTRTPGRNTHIAEGQGGPVELRRAADGFWQVWPRPTPEALRTLYRDAFYQQDKTSYLDDRERERDYWDAIWSMRRGLIEAALPATRRSLLDVGCSGGFLLDHFRATGWSAHGIEPSPHAAAWARTRFGLDVFCGELLEISPEAAPAATRDVLSGEGFDAIHCAQVLEHVLEPERCVARIASLLAPGGIAYIEVPNDFNVLQRTARSRLGKNEWWVAPDHHLNYFDYDSLSRLLARHGLVEIDRLASFPIEMFLLMGDDYVGHPEVGAASHGRRMAFERSLIEAGRIDTLAELYRALARAGIGRTSAILARKAPAPPDATRRHA